MPIDGLSINVSTTQGDIQAPVYGLARCPVTGDLIAITPAIRHGAMATGEFFVATHWRNGWQVSSPPGGHDSPRQAAASILRKIKGLSALGYDIAIYWEIQGADNPPPGIPLCAEWFVVPEQIAAFGWRGRVINRYREIAASHDLLEIRTPWGDCTPLISEAHAIAELAEIEVAVQMFDKKKDDWPKIDTVAMLAPWTGSKAEHREALGRHIAGLYAHMGKMRAALRAIRSIPTAAGDR